MGVFSFVNQKGGVGKTTLATNFATALAMLNQRVLFIDADEQESSLDWSGACKGEKPFSVVGLPNDTIHREIGRLSAPYDYTVIDGAPGKKSNTKSVIAAADMVVVPVQPSQLDIWACEDLVQLILDCQIAKPDLKAVFVINRKIVNTALGRDIRTLLEKLPFPTLQSEVSQRVTFAESIVSGLSVLETEPQGSAAREIVTLTKEILQMERNQEQYNGQENRNELRSAQEASA
jgi:chromosome partitioning protein